MGAKRPPSRAERQTRAGRTGEGPASSQSSGGRRTRPSRLTDFFEEEARRCATDADLRRILEDVTRELGFRYFALLHHASLRTSSGPLIRLDNYPRDWEGELVRRDLAADDPVHHASVRTNIGFAWDELGRLLALSRRQQGILEQSRRYGIGDGFTVPANVPGEPSGSCSFAMKQGRALPAGRLLCAELIGAHAFNAARRIHQYPGRGSHPHLSRRELQCLRLVAAGKTDWEIGRILGLSPETAHQYVKHARAVYDVVSRTQLVVHGLRDALISFDDAIPPDG
jgi:LuxR family quorum-sensing system transcriptional regulator CciR